MRVVLTTDLHSMARLQFWHPVNHLSDTLYKESEGKMYRIKIQTKECGSEQPGTWVSLFNEWVLQWYLREVLNTGM